MTDLGAWATEQYRVPGPTLTIDTSDTSLSGSLKADDHTEQRKIVNRRPTYRSLTFSQGTTAIFT